MHDTASGRPWGLIALGTAGAIVTLVGLVWLFSFIPTMIVEVTRDIQHINANR